MAEKRARREDSAARKTTACLSFGGKFFLWAGLHEKQQPSMVPGGMCWPWQSYSAWGHRSWDNFIFPKLGPRVNLGAAPHLSGHLRITRSQGQTHCPVSPGRVDTPLLTVLVSHGEHRVASRQQEHLGRCGPDITHANSPFNVPIQASKQKAATPHNCSNHSPVMHHLCGGLHAYLAPHR